MFFILVAGGNVRGENVLLNGEEESPGGNVRGGNVRGGGNVQGGNVRIPTVTYSVCSDSKWYVVCVVWYRYQENRHWRETSRSYRKVKVAERPISFRLGSRSFPALPRTEALGRHPVPALARMSPPPATMSPPPARSWAALLTPTTPTAAAPPSAWDSRLASRSLPRPPSPRWDRSAVWYVSHCLVCMLSSLTILCYCLYRCVCVMCL